MSAPWCLLTNELPKFKTNWYVGKDIFPSLQHIEDVSRWNKQALQKQHVFGCGSWYVMVAISSLKILCTIVSASHAIYYMCSTIKCVVNT